ncbi:MULTISPECIES: VOC family protein [Sphingobium]|jgi:predicted lactoylglutathione lyase|uniref:Glyoxalase family protein n=2 Tax=Sphingobium fuliginis (strain ATCC 27551) TaxID=336203 RepID=A0A292ZBJ1_SPHSA|nr:MULTISPECIES: VOC family protein [Sphingobium]OAP29947.1 lactoylglutathione lyase [Sphingobium sp. 20006FA]AJR22470.1 lactoylglutathione lyase [Sphingobium sp. YBL2]KXU30266.1 lactoylglutathione lyase [Sphingobium sp. AM]KYC30356.1 lactoylglutathione lyase [Sphingobium sp. 22B]MCB4862487.1 lactoylglutathione lyase [Sphingobium sp. PNB]
MPNAPAPKMIFVNLPVKDLAASIAFYEAVGAVRNNDFADDSAQMLSFSDNIHVMLLTRERFAGFTPRRIPDAHETAQVLLALSEASRADVDRTTEKALAAGGAEPNPRQDHGFMYGRSFADLDGHIWEVAWMDMEAALAVNKEAAA